MSDHIERIKRSILDDTVFVKATFSGQQRGQAVPWKKVVVRPVLIKNKRYVQFSYFDARQDTTKNYSGAQLAEKLNELLQLPFKSVFVQTTREAFQVQITKKGKAIIHQHEVSEHPTARSLQHDRRKRLLLPGDRPDPFLQTIGIMTKDGRVLAHMQKKFRQINEFLARIVETGELQAIEQSPLNIVDCGCGSAHLSFAVYHYLNNIIGLPARMIGVDIDAELLERRSELVQTLGWHHLTFQASRIVDFQPADPPGIVIALHACDTATDEALAQAVKWHSSMIFSAPCCHNHLQQQMSRQKPPSPFEPVLRHGVFKERFGDILTDAFRALILQILGYRTDIVEFVSTEHTGKNLMIRAVKSAQPLDRLAFHEYTKLKELWQVEPFLGQLLEKELIDAVQAAG